MAKGQGRSSGQGVKLLHSQVNPLVWSQTTHEARHGKALKGLLDRWCIIIKKPRK